MDKQPPALQTVRVRGVDHLRGHHGPRGGQEEASRREDPGILLLNLVMKPVIHIINPCFSVKAYNSSDETRFRFRSSSRTKSPPWVTITFGSPAPESMARDPGTAAAATTATVSSGQLIGINHCSKLSRSRSRLGLVQVMVRVRFRTS